MAPYVPFCNTVTYIHTDTDYYHPSRPYKTEGLETALFWGIRMTVVSTAINPFLYGLLARQCRMAYVYVFRLWLSKRCDFCVDPPLKDVFGECIDSPTHPHSQASTKTRST